MSVNTVSSVGNVNFKVNEVKPVSRTESQNLKSANFPFDVSIALKAQVLYQKPKNNIQYLDNSLDKKGIIKALKDKDKMGRSFFGYKSRVANIITKADDKNLAVDNFNILMNAQYEDGKKLNATDVTDILMVATTINNKKMSEQLANEYGFNGGKLDDKSIDSILDKITKQRELQEFAMLQQQMMHQQMLQQQIDQQMLQRQMMQQQMNQQMLQQQMQMQQQMMMTTPGMGFC